MMSSPPQVLIVDDELNWLETCRKALEDENYRVQVSEDSYSALDTLAKGDIDAVITDIRMPKMNGLQLLGEMKRRKLGPEVIVLTGYGTIEDAVTAIKLGAFNYLIKPVRFDVLLANLERIVKLKNLERQTDFLRGELQRIHGFGEMIGHSKRMEEVFEIIRKVSQSSTSVLIEGKSGTGKEMVADAIHYSSDRSGKPFVKINCVAVPETLLESELFGFDVGAFTGAVRRRIGKFEAANGGTLLLDEIADMPLSMQAKILRVIEDGRFDRLGGERTIETDIRIIASTNQDLQEKIANGTFREDLFYRISAIRIKLPPLTERREDLPLLVTYFLSRFSRQMNKKMLKVGPQTWKVFNSYRWPGNVRELENVVERLVVLLPGGTEIQPGHLPPELVAEAASLSWEAGPDALSLKEVEKRQIARVLTLARGNKTKAARLLGIHRETLYKKIREYDLSPMKLYQDDLQKD